MFSNIDEGGYYFQNDLYDKKSPIKRPTYSRALYLLMSYALENLLKGIAILLNPELITKGKLEKCIKTHDLNLLTKLNNIKLNESQIKFQAELSEQCISNARYPVGLHEQISNKDPFMNDINYIIYQNLFMKYKFFLIKEFNKKGWQSGFADPDLDTEPGEFQYFEK